MLSGQNRGFSSRKYLNFNAVFNRDFRVKSDAPLRRRYRCPAGTERGHCRAMSDIGCFIVRRIRPPPQRQRRRSRQGCCVTKAAPRDPDATHQLRHRRRPIRRRHHGGARDQGLDRDHASAEAAGLCARRAQSARRHRSDHRSALPFRPGPDRGDAAAHRDHRADRREADRSAGRSRARHRLARGISGAAGAAHRARSSRSISCPAWSRSKAP